jgi:hypothetical protein
MNPFEQFIEDSASSYLQSVVYIDDKIYIKKGNLDQISSDPIFSIQQPTFVSEGDVSSEETPARAHELVGSGDEGLALKDSNKFLFDDYSYHPEELMESFAEKGIICALYEPTKDANVDVGSTIYKLCQSADIVVLDWNLYNDDGAKVSRLIANLIKQSAEDQPHHVRLCTIYTDKPDLVSTAKVLLANLESFECQELTCDEDRLQLVSGATRISILGKPGVSRPPDIQEKFDVPERDLATRLLKDFSKMHRGLLSGLALKGLSSIRKNTKRLLDKFSCELDGAFILHRALVMRDHEALEELPELLANELLAILEDSLLDSIDYTSVTNEVIDSLKLAIPDGGDDRVTVCRQLKEGLVPFDKGRANKRLATLERYSCMVDSNGHSSSEKLSLLFNNRTHYLQVQPRLKFGTVVKHRKNGAEDDWQYSICLMPICDSQNRKQPDGKMSFPFWRLNDKLSSTNHAAFVIEVDGSTKRLSVGGKIREKLWLSNIKLNDGWARSIPGALSFDDINRINEIHWVAQLKPLHAQRIALHLGSEASRVGVTESEWLRLVLQKSPSEEPSEEPESHNAQPVSVIEERQTGDEQSN